MLSTHSVETSPSVGPITLERKTWSSPPLSLETELSLSPSPDEDNYFEWEGKLTSAQYYVNPSGGSASSQCIWGTSSGDIGNWAPVNFGAGSTGGVAWLSIMYNPLQTSLNIELQRQNCM